VGDYWGTGRVEAFSDGVIAIAIVLLVLEISVPESAFDDLWRGSAEEWPSYLAYATSFITIGGFWFAHHGIFRRLQYANRRVMLVNLLFLMAIAFLPYPTKLMAEAIHEAGRDTECGDLLRSVAVRDLAPAQPPLGVGRLRPQAQEDEHVEPLALPDTVLSVAVTSAVDRRRHLSAPASRPTQASAFCLIASNSACVIVPWSSNVLALAISAAAPPLAVSRT
jgi:Endosomal/lysosomal potassium channel TMEM175